MSKSYKVIDLFAGPGGLAEGFASVRAGRHRPFEIALSVEKEPTAHSTLRLRSFLRQFPDALPAEYLPYLAGTTGQPEWSALYPCQWAAAEEHALKLELGTKAASEALAPRLAELALEDTIVIGGPPCQAYSIAGRSRNQGKEDYEAREDARHFLYREYIRILKAVKPVAFVMENVKGLLTAQVDGVRILDLVLADLRSAGGEPDSYRLIALSPPGSDLLDDEPAIGADFVIRAEQHGVPQARHRIIIVGVRADHAASLGLGSRRRWAGPDDSAPANIEDALAGLPDLRSGLTGSADFQAWRDALIDQMNKVIAAAQTSDLADVRDIAEEATQLRDAFSMRCPVLPRSSSTGTGIGLGCPTELAAWLQGVAGGRVANHASRAHMARDLGRYFFAAVYAKVHGHSPKAKHFPSQLAPEHRNWASGHFTDRFRVQARGRPSTTVTSHISKDGHYFIHPDPLQCRALTVREAARLQTFPDDYLFLGNRTAQYVQVGNAVPPFLARKIGQTILDMLAGASEAVEPQTVGARGAI